MLELCEQLGVDFGLDLLAAQGARPFKAEHQRRAPALQGLAPDAHRGAHADITLIHLIVRGLGQPLRPARDHPFAFDFHKFIIPPILLASLCEGGGPARNISDDRKALSPTRCGGNPLPEGAKGGSFPVPSIPHSVSRAQFTVLPYFNQKIVASFVRLPVAFCPLTPYNRGITARALRMCFRSVLFL